MAEKTLKIIRGIAQAASRRFDGALNDDGTPVEMGLKREVGNPVTTSRIVDGWNVRIQADKLIFTYSSNTKIKLTHAPGFENEQIGYMNKAIAWLKREFNKVTGDTLALTLVGEPKTTVRVISNIRCWVELSAVFKIGGMTDMMQPCEEKPEKKKTWQDFVAQGGWGKGPSAQKGSKDKAE
jgi:hypothetical protein